MTVVKPGGTIVCAAECRDGFPDHGSYREVLASEAVAGGAARDDRGARAHGPGPVAGPGPGQGAGPRGRGGAHVVPLRRRPGLRAPRAHRRRRGDGARGAAAEPARTPGSACCPRARRPSPTSPEAPGSSRRSSVRKAASSPRASRASRETRVPTRRPSGGENAADPATLAARTALDPDGLAAVGGRPGRRRVVARFGPARRAGWAGFAQPESPGQGWSITSQPPWNSCTS